MSVTKFFTIALFCLLSSVAYANGIDDKCGALTYKTAPVVSADLYICHKEYAVAYSFKSKNPIYTTEFLSAEHTGSLPRTNNFRSDPAVPVLYRAFPSDYINSGTACNGGRCDQGHMTPDQDFSSCAVCVSESFFMTNMVPQNFKNNEVIWKKLEMRIRAYVAKHPKGVYVITGPVYLSSTPATIGKHKVWVPDYLFKVVIDAGTGDSIAYYMPNTPLTELSSFVVNLYTIEQVANIKFDSSLNKTTIADFKKW